MPGEDKKPKDEYAYLNPNEPLKTAPHVGKSIGLEGQGDIAATFGNTDFGESKYDDPSLSSEFINSGDYQYARGEKQSGLTQVGLGVLRAGSKALIEIAKTPAYLWSLGEYTASNADATKLGQGITLDKALDNAVLNALEDLDDNMKESLPVYKSYKSGKGGLMDNIASTSFWSSEGAEGVGYLLGMLAPGAALKAVNLAGKISKLGIGVSAANNMELGTMTMVNTAVESLAEAKGVADRLKQEGATPEQIADACRNTFNANLGILLIPNLIMNKTLLGRFGKDKSVLERFRDPVTGKLGALQAQKALKEYGKIALKMTASEGFLEEGGQTTVENYEVNHALGKDNRDFIAGIANEYLNTLSTTEGQKSILLGAVLGTIAGSTGKYRQDKKIEKIAPTITDLIDKNFEGFSVDNDIYQRNEDGSILIDPATKQPAIDLQKTTNALQQFIAESKDSQAQDLASLTNDKTLHDYITHNQFTRFVLPFIHQGELGLEILNEHLDNASKTRLMMDESQLADSKQTQFEETQHTSQLKQKAKDLFKLYTDTQQVIDNIKGLDNLENINNNPEFITDYKNRLFNSIFQENSKQLFYAEKMRDLNKEILEMQSAVSYELPQNKRIVDGIINDVKGLNNLLQDSKKAYNQLFEPTKVEDAYKNFLTKKQQEKDVITEQEANLNKEVEKELSKEDKQQEATQAKEEVDSTIAVLNDPTIVDNIDAFDSIYNNIKNNPYLTKEQKKSLETLRKSLEKVDKVVTKVDAVREQLGHEGNKQLFDNLISLLNQGVNSLTEDEKNALLKGLTNESVAVVGGVTDITRNNEERGDLDTAWLDKSDKLTGKELQDYETALSRLFNYINSDNRQQAELSTSIENEEVGKQLTNGIKQGASHPIFIGDIVLDILNSTVPTEIVSTTTTEEQEAVSERLNSDTIANQEEEDQADLNENLGDTIIQAEAGKHINLRGNVVMMHLFEHYFDKDGVFRFERNEEGLPDIDNNSNLDIDELSKIQEGDAIEMRLINLTEDQLKRFKAPKDFDGEHIGIYSNNKLIGFVQQPHPVDPKSENKDTSELIRKNLIEYRKAIIKDLKEGKTVSEVITVKGNGNLYTKLNEKGKIDAINNIIQDARDKDKINNALTFVFSNGPSIVFDRSSSSMSKDQADEIDAALTKYENYGKKGQVYQLIKDLTNSYSVIPVYSSLVNDKTVDAIFKSLEKYDNSTDPLVIMKELDNYLYTSLGKESASLLVENIYGNITFTLDSRKSKGIIGSSFTLDELMTNKSRKAAFVALLKTKRQNISITNINNKSYQDSLKDRNTIVSNVLTFNGEYFVQPYLEFSYNNLPEDNTITTVEETLNTEVSQKGTDIIEESIEDKIARIRKNKGIDEQSLSDDEALSTTIDTTELNRSKFNQWLNTNLPQLSLSDITNIADLKLNSVDAIGLFKDLTIYLFEGAGTKTAYHEAFHGVFRNILSLNDKTAILQEAIKKYDTPTVETLNALQKPLNKEYTLDQLRYLYYEEKLADDFAEFTYNYNNRSFLQKLKGKIKDFFNKILSYFNIFTLNTQSKIDEIFNKVNTKQYASKKAGVTNIDGIQVFNRPLEGFNEEYAYKILNKQGKTVFTPTTEQLVISTIGNKFLSVYQDNLSTGKKQTTGDIYNSIYKIYSDFLTKVDKSPESYTAREAAMGIAIFEHFQELKKHVDKYLAYRNIITSKEGDIEYTPQLSEDKVGDEEVRTLESHTTKGFGDWTSVSGLSSASTRLKMFLSSIPVMNDKNEIKKDVFGIEQFYDFNSLYYYIEGNLTDIYNLEDQISELNKLSKGRPEIKSVINKLGYTIVDGKVQDARPSNIKPEQLELLRNDFKTNFSKQQLVYTLVLFDTDSATGNVSYEIVYANRNSIERVTQQAWEDNLKDPNRDTITTFDTEGNPIIFGTPAAQALAKQWDVAMKQKTVAPSQVNHILNKVGIEFSPETLDLKANDAVFKAKLAILLNWYASETPLDHEITGRQALRDLVEYETTTVLNNYSSSFNDSENKNIYTIQLPTFASRLLAKLKSDDYNTYTKAIEDLKKDPFYRHSNLLESFEKDTPFRKNQFAVSFVDGLKDKRGDGKGVKFTSMSPKDFMNMQIALFQNPLGKGKLKSGNIAKYVYITPSDKSMSMIFDSKQYEVNMSEDMKGIRLNSEIIGKFYNVFLNEASRIKHNLDIKNDLLLNRENSKYKRTDLLEHYHISKKEFKKLTTASWEELEKMFDGQAFNFNYFSGKLNNETLNMVNTILQESTIEALEDNLEAVKDGILQHIQAELNKEYKSTLKEMMNKGIITAKDKQYNNVSLELTEGISEHEQIVRLAATFSANTLLANIELSNLLNGDIAMYKPNDLQKRTYHSQSMVTNNRFENPIIKTLVVKDVEVALKKEDLQSLGFTEQEAEMISSQYNDINVTDAQVYITPEFYKRIHVSRGTWTDDMQEALDIIEGKKKGKIQSSLRLLLGGIKPFYYGNRFDETLGIQRYEQVKCAMIPLFKGYTDINPLLAQKRAEMESKGVDMLAHESSFKAAIGYRNSITESNDNILSLDANNFGIQVDNPEHTLESHNDSMRQLKMLLIGSIDPTKMYKGTSGQEIIDTILKMEAANVRTALREFNKKLDVKNNANFSQFVKDMVTKRGATTNVEEILKIEDGEFQYPLDNGNLSTQIENLISSMFTNYVIKQDFRGGSAVQATSLGLRFRNLEEQQSHIDKLKTVYQGYNSENPEEREFNYFTSFENEAKTYGKNIRKITIDTTGFIQGYSEEEYKLRDEFQKESGNRFDILDNSKEGLLVQQKYFEFLKKKGFKGWSAIREGGDENMYAVTFYPPKDVTNLGLIQQELQWIKPSEEGDIEYAECAMPSWSKHFFDKNGLLKDINNIPDSLRQLIAYRIPTEGLHSMMPIKVVKFLPETMGNFILLPYEVTKQMGADFDFDKLYFITKEFYVDENTGEFKEYTYIPFNSEAAEDIRYELYKEYAETQWNEEGNKITTYEREQFSELPIEEQNTKAARNNNIIDNYQKLLTARENLHLLVKPSGFEKLKDIKNNPLYHFRDFEKDLFFSSRVQRDYKDRNHIGIALKGQSALHVSGHSYSTLLPLSTEQRNKNGSLKTEFSVNFNGTNEFTFNKLYTKDGELIADELSSIMAAILDDIKDPILEPLGINKNTIDVLATIIRAGYNMDTAIKFIAQPSLKELSSLLDANTAKIKEPNQGWNDINTVINQYKGLLRASLDENNGEIDLNEYSGSNITDDNMDHFLKHYKVQGSGEVKFVEYLQDGKKQTRTATPEELAKYYAFQIQVLTNFENISEIVKELGKVNKFFGINKQVGPNIEDIISKQELYDDIIESPILQGFNISLIPTLRETWAAHSSALEFFNKYFPYATDYYKNIKRGVYKMQFNKSLDQAPVDDKIFINGFIRTYTDNYFPGFANINEKYEDLFLSLPKLLADIKKSTMVSELYNGIPYGKIRENLFIQNIIYKYDPDNQKYYIKLKGNRLDLQVKNNIIAAFDDLYFNKNTKKLAVDLIEYSFASSGFFSGLNSFSNLINPNILAELGYMNHRKNLINALNNNEVAIEDTETNRIIDQLIRNNPKPFTKVFDAAMFGLNKNEAIPNTITTTEDLIKHHKRELDMILSKDPKSGVIQAPEYIRLYDAVVKRALLYKKVDELSYEFIPQLGKKGYMIEINPNENIVNSFMDENNVVKELKDSSVNEESNSFEDSNEKPVLEEDLPEYQQDDEFNKMIEDQMNKESNKKEDGTDLPDDIKPC